jgi:sodium-dependent dicarboxylate transporter 2/3/5
MRPYRRFISLLSGVAIFLLFIFLNPFRLDANAVKVAAVAVLMITWWVVEALPMPVVALLPLILFPLMGVAKMDEAAAPYANPIIFLCIGGFLLGLAVEKWNLHKRIALSIINITGTSGNRIVLGFMIATGFLSMWLQNTATTMMMFPIAMSVIKVMEDTHKDDKVGSLQNLSVCLMLAIAYASNLGGISSIIGTSTNVAFVAFLEKQYNYSFDFRQWMMLCIPLSFTLLVCLYFVMVKWLYPNRIPASDATKQVIQQELQSLGKMSKPEKRVLGVFLFTALLWITRDLLDKEALQSWILSIVRGKTVTHETFFKLDDTMIAVFGGFLLFLLPSDGAEGESKQLLEWKDTTKIAWGLLLLLGGGITLAAQLEKAGVINLLGQWIASFSASGFWLVFLIAILSVFISETVSNVAQVLVFAPVIAGVAEALHASPLQLGMAMTLAASCAGMLPMGTPPNAIVFASGKLKLKDMTITGFVMNIVAAFLVSLFCWYLLPIVVTAI